MMFQQQQQRNITLLSFLISIAVVAVTVLSVAAEELCISNGVGNTCDSTSQTNPKIVCCISKRTGASFNSCCSSDFGIVGQFTTTTIGGAEADCEVNSNNLGCDTTVVPGNDGTQTIDYAGLGTTGPCKKVDITTGTITATDCSNNDPTFTHGGTCTNTNEGTFNVCCPPGGTGTYTPGDSCNVSLPSTLSKSDGDDASNVADDMSVTTESNDTSAAAAVATMMRMTSTSTSIGFAIFVAASSTATFFLSL